MDHEDLNLKFIRELDVHYLLNLQVIAWKLLSYQGFLHLVRIL